MVRSLRLKRNSAFNLAGGVVPALAALAVVPLIVRGLGSEGYGLLVLVTSIIGYFALLDLNITAGSTKYVAEHHARGDPQKVNETISFGLLVYAVIGLVGGTLIFGLAGWLSNSVFNVAPESRDVARHCLQVAALGFLFGQMQLYLQSIPQALMRYDITARMEMVFGVAVPLGSVALLAAGGGLVALIWLRVCLSLVNALLLWRAVVRVLPAFRWQRPHTSTVRQMGAFSAYAMLNRVAAVSYLFGDKLIIGAVVGMKPLAIYAVATTIGNRLLGMMYRASAVLFPAASALTAVNGESRLREAYLRLGRYVVFVNASGLLLLVVFAEPLLKHWIGPDFASGGARVLQFVALGQFIDSLSNLPSLVNDGRGHPRVTGLFALSRAVVGLLAVYVLALQFGIVGAALAHLLSGALLVTLFLAYVHDRTVPVSLKDVALHAWAMPLTGCFLVAVLVAWSFSRTAGTLPELAAAMLGAVLLLAAFGWRCVARPADRESLLAWWRQRWGRKGRPQ